MKPISQKVVEAGLVSKHALLLFKRWGYLDPEDTNLPEEGPRAAKGEQLKEGFSKFVEELDTLLEERNEEEIKETRFSITLKDPFVIQWMYEEDLCYMDSKEPTAVVFQDEIGRLIFPPQTNPEDRYFRTKTGGKSDRFQVTSCIPLWHDDTLYAYQVEAESF